jgi:hypothetical protein
MIPQAASSVSQGVGINPQTTLRIQVHYGHSGTSLFGVVFFVFV